MIMIETLAKLSIPWTTRSWMGWELECREIEKAPAPVLDLAVEAEAGAGAGVVGGAGPEAGAGELLFYYAPFFRDACAMLVLNHVTA